jgi:SNF2 family DNA or RNA helicase
MGLGKTIQTLLILGSAKMGNFVGNSTKSPSLIICPASVVRHWENEVKKIFPENFFSVMVYSGTPEERERYGENFRNIL